MKTTRILAIGMAAAALSLAGGCAWWYETPAREGVAWAPASAFSITLHCESEEQVRADQQGQLDAWLAVEPAGGPQSEGALGMGEDADVESADAWVDDECDSLLSIMREGSADLLSDARYERAGRRL